jgi:hypothetical protein
MLHGIKDTATHIEPDMTLHVLLPAANTSRSVKRR